MAARDVTLEEVRHRFNRANVPVTRDGDRLELTMRGEDTLIVRVMEDPGHVDRVHLRSVTPTGEVTISTQRMTKLKLLIDYARVLVASASRANPE